MKVKPKLASEIAPVEKTIDGRKAVKFYFRSRKLEELWSMVPEMFTEFCTSVSKVMKSDVLIVAVGEKIRPYRYNPKRDLSVRKQIANARFIDEATPEQLFAMLQRDCRHCAKPYCSARLCPYECECDAVCNQDLREAAALHQMNLSDLQDEIAIERVLTRHKTRND